MVDTVLRDPEVDVELPLELGRLHLLLQAISAAEPADESTRAEIAAQIGGWASIEQFAAPEVVEDKWFVAGRRVDKRGRLITRSTWLIGKKSQRWARLLRFAPIPQPIAELWPLGPIVSTALQYTAGLLPFGASGEGSSERALPPVARERGFRKTVAMVRTLSRGKSTSAGAAVFHPVASRGVRMG